MDGYALTPYNYGTVKHLNLLRIDAGASSILQYHDDDFWNKVYRIRAHYSLNTGLLQWRAWVPEDGDSEPTVWQYRTVWNDAVHYTNGRFGLYKYYSDNFYIQYFSYGLDASAPLPEDVPTLAADTLTATATGTSTIDVGITENDASVTGRTLWQSTAGGAFVQIADLGADPAATYEVSGLSPDTLYAFRTEVTDGTTTVQSNAPSATTDALPLPPASLTVVALDYGEAQLYWTIQSNVQTEDGLYVYRYTESGAALDPSMRVADVAAGTEVYDDGGVPRPGWTYYWKVASYYGASEFASVEVSAVMPSRLGVAYVTNSSAGLMFQFEPTSLAVRYRVTTADDEDFASPILDETVAGDLRGIYVAEGLDDATDFIAEAQEQAADGTWGDWHYAFITTVLTPPIVPIGEWTSHHDGSIVSGTINVAWDLAWGGRLSGWRAYLIEARAATDPDGDWTTLAEDAALADAEVGGISIDTSIWPDGFAWLRLTAHDADDSEQGQMTLVFLADNAGVFAATSGGISEGDYTASLVGCGGRAIHSEVYMDRYGEPMFGGHLGALNAVCPGEVCVIPPDMQQSGEDGATAAVAGHFTATGIWLWWMNLQIEASFFAIDFIDQTGAARVTVMVKAENVWPIWPCDDSLGFNLRGNGTTLLVVDDIIRSMVNTPVKGGWPGNCPTLPSANLIWATVRRVAGSADQWDITYQAPFRKPAVAIEGVTDGYGVHAATERFTLPGLDCVCCVRFRAGRAEACSWGGDVSGGSVTFLESYGATFFGDSCVDCVICGAPPPVCVVDRVFEVHGAEGDTFDLAYYPDGGDPAEAVSLATAAEPGMFVWDVHDLDQGTYFVLVTPTDGSDPWTIQVEVRYLELPARTYYIEPAVVPARPDCNTPANRTYTVDTTP